MAKKTHPEELLEKAARKIGSAIGTVVAKTGHPALHQNADTAPRIIDGKYQKSHKSRLPRKLKKRQKQMAMAGSARQPLPDL